MDVRVATPPDRRERGALNHPRDGARLSRAKLIVATVLLVAHGGTAAARAEAAEETARQRPGTVVDTFGDERQLLHSTIAMLAQVPVLPPPTPHPKEQRTIDDVLQLLARAHRQYVDTDPARYAAITHVTSTAIFGDRTLLPLLAARSRRTRAIAASHLHQLREAGATQCTPEQLDAIAGLFVDGATGIELCHLIERNTSLRVQAYDELLQVTKQQLSNTA